MKKILLFLISVVTINSFSQELEWVNRTGGTSNDFGMNAVRDANGNIYNVGFFEGTVDFDPGTNTFNLTSVGSSDGFIQKLDANGDFVWAKSIGGTLANRVTSIDVDDNNNLLLTGYFEGTADFNPGASSFNLTSSGFSDAFVEKLDSDGNFVWVKQVSGSSFIQGLSITLDANDNVYTTGQFFGTADFDPSSAASFLSSSGTADVFIQKLDSNGDFVWSKKIGGSSFDKVTSIVTDVNNNVYCSGSFQGTSDFDPSGAVSNLTSAGDYDGYVIKLNTNGDFTWVKQIAGSSLDEVLDLAIDINNDLYVSGSFQNSVDFDPSPSNLTLTSAGGADGFIQKLDLDGNLIWVKQIGGAAYDFGSVITTDVNSNVYLSGQYRGITDFDPGSNTFNLTPVGAGDIFVQKLDVNGDFIWAQSMGGSDTDNPTEIIVDENESVFVIGYFEGTADFDPSTNSNNLTSAGNFDMFVFKLVKPCVPISGTDTRTECNAYTWIDGIEYTSDNSTATFNIVGGAANGCDSLVTLDLTIINSAEGTDTRTECNAYTWIDGIQYTANNNTATFNIIGGAANGCDSLVSLDLTINSLDITTSVNNFTITANNSSASSYQWINCANNSQISGATQVSFTAEENGEYAVIVSDNDCSDTSACVTIAGLGINNQTYDFINVYPNPSSGIVNIELHDLTNVDIKVFNISGQLIYNSNGINTEIHQFNLDAPKGIYFVEVAYQNSIKTVKLFNE
jgi:hypothetical protein